MLCLIAGACDLNQSSNPIRLKFIHLMKIYNCLLMCEADIKRLDSFREKIVTEVKLHKIRHRAKFRLEFIQV